MLTRSSANAQYSSASGGDGGESVCREVNEAKALFGGEDIYEGLEKVGAGMEEPQASGMTGESTRDGKNVADATEIERTETGGGDQSGRGNKWERPRKDPSSALNSDGHPLGFRRNTPPPPSHTFYAYRSAPLPSAQSGSVLIGSGGKTQRRIKNETGLADLSVVLPPAAPEPTAVLFGSRAAIRRALALMDRIINEETLMWAQLDERDARARVRQWIEFDEGRLELQKGLWLKDHLVDHAEASTQPGPEGGNGGQSGSGKPARSIPTAAAVDFLPTSGCVPFIEQLSGTKVSLSTSSNGTQLAVTGPEKLALRQALNDIQRVVAQKVPGWTAPATEEEELASASAAFVSRSSKPSSTFSTPTSDGRRRSPARSLSVSSAEYDSAPPSRRRSRSRRSLSPYRKTNERYEQAEDEYGRRNGLGRGGYEHRSRANERGRDERRDRHGRRGRTIRQDRNDEHYTRSTSPPLKRLGLYNLPPSPPGRNTFDRPPYPAPPRSYHRSPPRQAPRNPPADLDFAVGGGPVHLELGGTVRQDQQRGGRQGGRGWRRFGEDKFVERRMERVEQWRSRG
ncbi:hypothetical protein JCM10213_002668 [Rhodosporidiobolus nylandii]